MPTTVCLIPSGTFYYPEGGGHLWVYVNWALGLKSLGCEVIWLECVWPSDDVDQMLRLARGLRERLAGFGLGDSLAVHLLKQSPASPALAGEFRGLDCAASQVDLLISAVGDHNSSRFLNGAKRLHFFQR
jgi:hypothetical protein